MSRRPLLKADRWKALFAASKDERELIRHCTLDPADLDLVMVKRTPHNRLGLAVQLCLVDTGGAIDHVFALFAVLGRRLVPRLRDLKDWSLYILADADPLLRQHIGGRIDQQAIREASNEVLRIALSIEDCEVAPSAVLKKLAAMPKTNLLARALREIGRIERTLFMIEWCSSPALGARCRAGLNKGEAGHKLTRAVFFHERGEIRDAAFEAQAFRASALHVSPQIWEHINLIGTYDWSHQDLPLLGAFRPLRRAPSDFRTAA